MAQKLNRVQPGDVITADMWNLAVDAINELMESGQTSGIKIAATVPTGTSEEPLRIGTVLQIVGKNFGFSIGQSRVIFEWTTGNIIVPRDKMLTGSADDRLLLIVPPIPVPQTGATMTMRVDNGVANDARSVFVIPIVINLEGDMFVNWRADVKPNPNPNPLQPNKPAEFAFQLTTGINLPATFDLSADILDATTTVPSDLVKSIRFFDAKDGSELASKRVEMGKSETRNILVRIPLLPASFADQSFKLKVSATSGNITGTGTHSSTVGKPDVETDPDIHPLETGTIMLDENLAETNDPNDGTFDGATIKLRAGKQRIVMYNVTFDQKGNYEVTLSPKAGTTLKGWNPFPDSNTPTVIPVKIDKDPVAKDAQFSVSVDKTDASTNGTVVFRIKRQGATSDWTKEFDVQLLP